MGKPVVHFEIGGRDREKASAFYSDLFGWSTTDSGPYSKDVHTAAERGIMGHLTALGHEPHNYVMIYVEVEDIPLYLQKVEELGGQVIIPHTEVPGQGSFAWFNDIDGNMLGLWQSAAE